jgi:superfamily I DNA/RNA helicase
MVDWTRDLNQEQKEAATHTRGPLLILAGAGSGKTTVLVSRTGYLLQKEKIQSSELCVLTFTNKAARELKHRVASKVGENAEDLWTGTFHSFGLKLLRRYHKKVRLPSGFGVIDQADSVEILKELTGHIKNSQKDQFKMEKLLTLINSWRETGRRTPQNPSDEYEVMTEALLPGYLRKLELLGVVDFEGLLLKPLELFEREPQILDQLQNTFSFVMVDEFQDTNETQFKLVKSLVGKHQNLAVVGDDDQSIYGWRGACVSNILHFPQQFKNCKVIRLERNYRSTPAILDLANEVISKNKDRHGKKLKPDPQALWGSKPELFIYDSEESESEEVSQHIRYFIKEGYDHQDIAVLYRSNGQGGLIEAHLRRSQIPYTITGGTGFFDRKEIKDILAYLRCSVHPNEIAFRRIINAPSRGIGEATIEKIENYSDRHGLKFHVASRKWTEAGVPQQIGNQLDSFFHLLDELPGKLFHKQSSKTPGQALLDFLLEIGYRQYLSQTCKDGQALEKRWIVVEIFSRVMDQILQKSSLDEKGLLEFLDKMELRDLIETDEDPDANPKVQLLTLHACKGLEFPVVIFVGCEEDLIPHRTLGSDISEERRLFYVGVTRAKEKLVFTRARTRKKFGRVVESAPSRFLLEITSEKMISFESGFRPVNESQRKDLLKDFFKKIESQSQLKKIL